MRAGGSPLLLLLLLAGKSCALNNLGGPLRRVFRRGNAAAPDAISDELVSEMDTPAGRAKLSQVIDTLSDSKLMDSITDVLPSFGGSKGSPEELSAIKAARDALPDDPWMALRSDEELLPFVRGASSGDLVERLAETSAWRSKVIPPMDDQNWELSTFFGANQGKFYENDELGERPFLQWVKARDGDEEGAPPLQLEGASLLILRPGRHSVGAIDSETWLSLIAWQGERATTTWRAAEGKDDAESPGRGAVTLIVDRTGSGLRNQDPTLLRELLPALTRHFPYSLHRAYVAPVNIVFWAIWSVARVLLPTRVSERFTLLRGDDWQEQLANELGPIVSARVRAAGVVL